jgi:hypothetical protein
VARVDGETIILDYGKVARLIGALAPRARDANAAAGLAARTRHEARRIDHRWRAHEERQSAPHALVRLG